MYSTIASLIDRLDKLDHLQTGVIQWSSPVPFFGDLSKSRVATLGLNPSNREFVDGDGKELTGTSRRFHTLNSLGLDSWSDVDVRHLHKILESCNKYFIGNPYDRWFRKLNQVVTGAKASYYDTSCEACHLDLIPYATADKWGELTPEQRSILLSITGDTLGLLLRDSPVEILILNGRSVVEYFQNISGITLDYEEMPHWTLPRSSKKDVLGIAYTGIIDTVSDIMLGHKLLVLGFNHNLQSSYGVTTEVINSIRSWIAQSSEIKQ